MAQAETLVGTVGRAMVRTVGGCLAGLLLLGLGLGLAVGPGLVHDGALGGTDLRIAWDVGESTDSTPSAQDRLQRRVSRLSERRDCSRTGFGAEVIPASAVVKVRGQVRSVSFDEGWAIHHGERPGRLLAVCRR